MYIHKIYRWAPSIKLNNTENKGNILKVTREERHIIHKKKNKHHPQQWVPEDNASIRFSCRKQNSLQLFSTEVQLNHGPGPYKIISRPKERKVGWASKNTPRVPQQNWLIKVGNTCTQFRW